MVIAMLRVAAYQRISENRTDEQLGVERQKADIERYWAARDAQITWFADDDTSAFKRNKPRPEFDKMMNRVDAGEFDVVTARHMDRLLRRLTEFTHVYDRCKAAGAWLVTTADGVDTSTDGGKLVAGILAMVAEQEMDRKIARQVSANKQKADLGRWTGGRRPFGYEKNGTTIIPEEAAMVLKAHSAIVSGRSLYSVAKDWNAAGFTTTVGNPWTGPSLRQVLVNPRYAGLRSYHGDIVGEATWDAIVPLDKWATTVAYLNQPGRQVAQTARKHLMTGLLRCGKCASPIGSSYNGGGIYKCKKCGGVSRRREPIDKLVTKLVLGYLGSPEAAELLIDRSREDVHELREQEAHLIDRIDQLALDHLDGLLNARQVKIATDRIEAQLEEVRNRLVNHTRSGVLDGLVCSDPEPVWEKLTLDRRRAVIAELAEFTLLPSGRGVRFQPEQLTYRWLLAEE